VHADVASALLSPPLDALLQEENCVALGDFWLHTLLKDSTRGQILLGEELSDNARWIHAQKRSSSLPIRACTAHVAPKEGFGRPQLADGAEN
jgi:hypothetical protein